MKFQGFIAPIIKEQDHVFGASGINLPVINPSGDWTAYLPTFSSQLEKNFDSDGCTVYNTLTAIEVLEKFLYNTSPTYSDRFVYNCANIAPPGSDPQIVATTIRGQGLVTDADLPDTVNSLAEFMTPRPLTIDLRIKGQKWLSKRQLGHQYLWTTQPDATTRVLLLKDALTKGTVCISVTAWYKDDNGLFYSPKGLRNGHWTCIYKIDETGMYVFDSYNDALTNTNLKKLTLDHSIEVAKVYFLTTPSQQQNWLVGLITSLLQLVGLRQQQVPSVIEPVKKNSEPMKTSKITQWATAIAKWEGDTSGTNPGNLKYSPLIASWGATQGRKGSDGGYFAKFETYAQGFLALCNFLTLGCHDELKAYHHARTFEAFTKIYAGNPPHGYIEGIRAIVGCELNTDISTFL